MVETDGDEPNVYEAMSRPVITIDGNSTIQEAALLLRKHGFHGLVVVDKKTKHVDGVITDKDIIAKVVAENKSPREMKVKDVMSPKLITAEREETVSRIAKVMYANGVSRAPVIDGDGHLIGIITTTDITRVLPGVVDVLGAKREIDEPPKIIERPGAEGRCEECGNIYEDLVEIKGIWLCSSCAEQYTEIGTKKREFPPKKELR